MVVVEVMVVVVIAKVIITVIVQVVPVVPRKAVVESRIGKELERLLVVSHGCQSKNTDQLTN